MDFVKFDNLDIGIILSPGNNNKILYNNNGMPGIIYSRSVERYIPNDSEAKVFSEYYDYYNTVREFIKSRNVMEKASVSHLVPKKVLVRGKNRNYYRTVMVAPKEGKLSTKKNVTLSEKDFNDIKSGDKGKLLNFVFNVLYDNDGPSPLFKNTVSSYAKGLDHDDVIQEASMVMLKKQANKKFNDIPAHSMAKFLLTTVLNVARTQYRNSKLRSGHEEKVKPEVVENDINTDILRSVGINVISKIKSSEKKNNFKMFLSGMSHKEMSERLGITENASKQTIKYINHKIRDEMISHGYNKKDKDPAKAFRDAFREKIGKFMKMEKARQLANRFDYQGMQISVETDTGMIREGVDSDGNEWSVFMNYPYGYIRGTMGSDGDHIDCFIGPNSASEKVFIVHQLNPDGSSDEDKVFLGFNDKISARKAYFDHYDRNDLYGGMDEVDIESFKNAVFNRKNHGKQYIDMEKATRAEIGEVRTWGGKKYRKTGEKTWEPVQDGNEKEEDGKDKKPDSKKEKADVDKSEVKKYLKNFFKNLANSIMDMYKGIPGGQAAIDALGQSGEALQEIGKKGKKAEGPERDKNQEKKSTEEKNNDSRENETNK